MHLLYFILQAVRGGNFFRPQRLLLLSIIVSPLVCTGLPMSEARAQGGDAAAVTNIINTNEDVDAILRVLLSGLPPDSETALLVPPALTPRHAQLRRILTTSFAGEQDYIELTETGMMHYYPPALAPHELDRLPHGGDRNKYPILDMYFRSGRLFHNQYLLGVEDRSHPLDSPLVTPLMEPLSLVMPKKLDTALPLVNARGKCRSGNCIIVVLEEARKGLLYIYWQGRLLANSQVSSGRRVGWTTAGHHRVLTPYTPWKKSHLFNMFPMPYSVHYGGRSGDEFLHAGNIGGHSHGCIRLPAVKSALIWKLVRATHDTLDERFELVVRKYPMPRHQLQTVFRFTEKPEQPDPKRTACVVKPLLREPPRAGYSRLAGLQPFRLPLMKETGMPKVAPKPVIQQVPSETPILLASATAEPAVTLKRSTVDEPPATVPATETVGPEQPAPTTPAAAEETVADRSASDDQPPETAATVLTAGNNTPAPLPYPPLVDRSRRKPGFVVAVGSYRFAEIADAVEAELERMGLPVYRQHVRVRGQRFRRVRVGPAMSMHSAREILHKIQSRSRLKAYVVAKGQ